VRIRHILPEFGRVPRDVLQDSMSGNVRAAVTIATRQSRVGDDCVELLGLNRDRPNRSSRLEGVRIWATRGLRIGEMGSMDWRYLLPLYARALESSADVLRVHDNPTTLSCSLPHAQPGGFSIFTLPCPLVLTLRLSEA